MEGTHIVRDYVGVMGGVDYHYAGVMGGRWVTDSWFFEVLKFCKFCGFD